MNNTDSGGRGFARPCPSARGGLDGLRKSTGGTHYDVAHIPWLCISIRSTSVHSAFSLRAPETGIWSSGKISTYTNKRFSPKANDSIFDSSGTELDSFE